MTIDTGRFQTLLLEERHRVERALEITPTGDSHTAEAATTTLDREIDYTLEENSTRMLTAIDDSLRRIDNGTYGTCARCQGAISEARLEAYPWASLCIDCKREAERG
jgi:RNA polymerase-binding transcription factor